MSKKTLIAALGVAAGLGVAAMPAAGVFADPATDDSTEEIKVIINEALEINCVTETTAGASEVTMASGQSNSDLSTKCTVVTNAAKGFTLSVKDVDSELALTNSGTRPQDRIEAVANAATTEGWSLTNTDGTGAGVVTSPFAIKATDQIIHYQADPTDDQGKSVTVNYTFNTLADQAAGTYTDEIVYTATANV
ncbi:MAG: hypothetical protein Q4E47_00335 [Candidatus Saccharibacteria bacterium]|nr:hypothetical protein [Candidatus Saccharibacteria bacterium]